MERSMSAKIRQARKVLTDELKKDSDFYYGYQSNIAVAFVDEFNDFYKEVAIADKTKHEIHQIANLAAKRFLDMWISS